ncbi:MAG TPA: hypothetical protein PLI94_07855 [Bacillota bacterium]|nr:hypothetical protein [Bacillota bacterium]HPT67937.1 hypothetical protein [Bacillota bacterium]
MTRERGESPWLDPNKEGRRSGRQSRRYCSRCGNTVKQFRILRGLNLCEPCVRELEHKRDGQMACKGCGRLAPKEVKEHGGYCLECICPACGRPDPSHIRKTGLCLMCAEGLGEFCRRCGKEAAAQVRKNRGLCNVCAGLGKKKQ